MLSRNRINQLKRQYPKDTPIELLNMNGEPQMYLGLKGTVLAVDDIGQIHVSWENGSTLALDVEADNFRKLTEQELSEPEQEESELPGMDMNQQM